MNHENHKVNNPPFCHFYRGCDLRSFHAFTGADVAQGERREVMIELFNVVFVGADSVAKIFSGMKLKYEEIDIQKEMPPWWVCQRQSEGPSNDPFFLRKDQKDQRMDHKLLYNSTSFNDTRTWGAGRAQLNLLGSPWHAIDWVQQILCVFCLFILWQAFLTSLQCKISLWSANISALIHCGVFQCHHIWGSDSFPSNSELHSMTSHF